MSRPYKHTCPCGNGVDLPRWEAGYHYCRDSICFERFGKKRVSLFERPNPHEVDLDPLELDEVAEVYDVD